MPKSKGGRRPAKRRNLQRQAQVRVDDDIADNWSPRTYLIVFVLGSLCVCSSAIALVGLFVPGLVVTVGSGTLNYVVDPDTFHNRNWPSVIAIFGSLVGFNLVYFGAAESWRHRALASMTILYAVAFVTLGWAAVWVAGTGRPVDSLFKSTKHGGGAVAGVLAGTSVMIAAAGIMLWLEATSSFPQQRDEYFGAGSAKVVARGIGMRPHLIWVSGLLGLWLLTLLPIYVAHWRSAGNESAGAQRPWPHPLTAGNHLVATCGLLASVFAALWGLSASFLVQKWLYRGPLAKHAAGTADPFLLADIVARLRHVPFVIAALALTFTLAENPAGHVRHHYVVGSASSIISALLGVLLLTQAWRGRSMSSTTLRLHRLPVPVSYP